MNNSPVLSRRFILGAAPAAAALFGTTAHAQAPSGNALLAQRLSPRIIGNPNAKVLVQEWFSLTCTHCAHFATEEFPEIKAKLIDTGKIRYQFHDFTGDQVGLTAAMVARALPEERYVPFLEALFSSQMQWAFNREGDPIERLKQISALAGISSSDFDAIHNDMGYMQALFEQVKKDSETYNITGTPYFRFNNTTLDGDPDTYAHFAELVAKAS
ncbi:thiol:disulfide interchange protein [Neokomagataea thailandica NBRC 106555]|uniref:Thiol:disulfide interchange protein n=2 Tax=Neokomagataea TaxID=1223423 RepID=A0A4Y6V607_9PROT|nr:MULTISPECIES: thioredoxin domain-containing protein [Neokomagataea]QDH24298.1 thiol:disulfide interchange protein [Neokomagataea tanensis]GBR53073.1 thiol:disulfide interchange protein [Neokomagataea thailandica NBRC 106555]